MIPRHSNHDEDDRAHEKGADGLGGVLRRARASHLTAEERLEQLLAERRREVEEHAARFEERVLDLERREELLRDERASVERLLRRSATDPEAREEELVQFERELKRRESQLEKEEAQLNQRRRELGAVELKRATVEQRERAVEAREDIVAAREEELEAREAESAVGSDPTGPTPSEEPDRSAPQLLFVPGDGYRLVEFEPGPVSPGETVQLEGEDYVVARLGSSPLPRDSRRCAYLVRGGPRVPASGGSS